MDALPKLKKLELGWVRSQLAVVDVSYLADKRPSLELTVTGAHVVRGAEGFAEGRLTIRD